MSSRIGDFTVSHSFVETDYRDVSSRQTFDPFSFFSVFEYWEKKNDIASRRKVWASGGCSLREEKNEEVISRLDLSFLLFFCFFFNCFYTAFLSWRRSGVSDRTPEEVLSADVTPARRAFGTASRSRLSLCALSRGVCYWPFFTTGELGAASDR